jgi:selenide, water dikinase
MGPGDLEQALCGLAIPEDPNVLCGVKGSEDAGVYKIAEDMALVQTIDFFTPIVDDPFIFGKVAAANSLSDVYAMGGRPITAMNVVCFPTSKLGVKVLGRILAGGLEILKEAGVALVGGHSVEDAEPKYGLSVTGLVNPNRIMTNSGLKPGDRLILTKGLGTGVIATAGKAQVATESSMNAMIDSMRFLNKTASEIATQFGVRGCTDVTGFGLAGHVVEMARAGKCRIRINAGAVPLIDGALDAVRMGMIPGGAYSNQKFFRSWVTLAPEIPSELAILVFDPQTSGGLVLGIKAEKAGELVAALRDAGVQSATEIGEVLGEDKEGHLEIGP